VLTFSLAAPAEFSGQRIPLFYHEVLERVRALPGVESAVLARNLPMSGTDPSMPIEIEGTPPPPSEIPVVTRLRAVGPGYFSGLRTSLPAVAASVFAAFRSEHEHCGTQHRSGRSARPDSSRRGRGR
jgi:hypothetical protein